jgi:hypothetical protein
MDVTGELGSMDLFIAFGSSDEGTHCIYILREGGTFFILLVLGKDEITQ